jgi:hypothetical protein
VPAGIAPVYTLRVFSFFLAPLLEVKSDILFLVFIVNRRGLGAARELSRGEMVLRVPKAALLTTESVLSDPKISSFVESHKHLSPVQVGICFCSFPFQFSIYQLSSGPFLKPLLRARTSCI